MYPMEKIIYFILEFVLKFFKFISKYTFSINFDTTKYLHSSIQINQLAFL